VTWSDQSPFDPTAARPDQIEVLAAFGIEQIGVDANSLRRISNDRRKPLGAAARARCRPPTTPSPASFRISACLALGKCVPLDPVDQACFLNSSSSTRLAVTYGDRDELHAALLKTHLTSGLNTWSSPDKSPARKRGEVDYSVTS
jgi:hypothetical protein